MKNFELKFSEYKSFSKFVLIVKIFQMFIRKGLVPLKTFSILLMSQTYERGGSLINAIRNPATQQILAQLSKQQVTPKSKG